MEQIELARLKSLENEQLPPEKAGERMTLNQKPRMGDSKKTKSTQYSLSNTLAGLSKSHFSDNPAKELIYLGLFSKAEWQWLIHKHACLL